MSSQSTTNMAFNQAACATESQPQEVSQQILINDLGLANFEMDAQNLSRCFRLAASRGYKGCIGFAGVNALAADLNSLGNCRIEITGDTRTPGRVKVRASLMLGTYIDSWSLNQ
jgi:hypothetical protein